MTRWVVDTALGGMVIESGGEYGRCRRVEGECDLEYGAADTDEKGPL